MKRAVVALVFALAMVLPPFAHAAGPRLTVDAWYNFFGNQAYSYYIYHGLGYIPIVQPVSNNSNISAYAFKVSTTEAWVYTKNNLAGSQSGLMKIYFY